MRSVLLTIILVTGLQTPILGQQLKSITNSIGMKLVLIHAGSFRMGSPDEEEGRQELQESAHEISISKPFYLGVFEVTQSQFGSLVGTNPSFFQKKNIDNRDTSGFPVEMVTWNDAVAFCEALSELPEEKSFGREYRLPTEAEWEYACRATTSSAFSFGDSKEPLEEHAWSKGGGSDPLRLDHQTNPVGMKKANRWGLYDMHGNVGEWCHDWFGLYPSVFIEDPQGPLSGSVRVFRGGGWKSEAVDCRAARREGDHQMFRNLDLGFRVALSPSVNQPNVITKSKDLKAIPNVITNSTDLKTFPNEIDNRTDVKVVLESITNSIGMKLLLIQAGTFMMGSPIGEVGRNEGETPHLVTISNRYYLGAYEVTQEQYGEVMGNNPSAFKGAQKAVEMVSWNDAVSFCKKLSELPEEKAAGREYRLPTEAEWEYACRADSTTTYSFGETAESLGEYAWFGEGREGKTHKVGLKKPNRWGLYDMHGNVGEWCDDRFSKYSSGEATDPQGPRDREFRIFRGDSFFGDENDCRSAQRGVQTATSPGLDIGFRIALSLTAKNPESVSNK